VRERGGRADGPGDFLDEILSKPFLSVSVFRSHLNTITPLPQPDESKDYAYSLEEFGCSFDQFLAVGGFNTTNKTYSQC